jgi:hypothetical protein
VSKNSLSPGADLFGAHEWFGVTEDQRRVVGEERGQGRRIHGIDDREDLERGGFPLESHLCSSLCFYGGGPDLLRLRRFGRVRHDVVAVERVQTRIRE